MVSVVRGPNPVPSPASIRTGPQFQTTSAAGKRSRETQPELALLAKHVPRQQLLQQIRSASTRTLTFSVQLSSEFACVICTAGFAASLVPGHSSHVPMYHLLYVPLLCCVVWEILWCLFNVCCFSLWLHWFIFSSPPSIFLFSPVVLGHLIYYTWSLSLQYIIITNIM